MSSKLKHILRYGTNADQDYFSSFDSCYDIVAINASMAAFSPNALAAFVAKKTPDKEFFVDPMTHIFQHNKGLISSEKKVSADESAKTPIKKSIFKLVNEYAKNIDGFIEDDGEKNYDLLREKIRDVNIDKAFYRSFAEGVLNFQRNLVPKDRAQDYADYIDYANTIIKNPEDQIIFNHTPKFLVAPYFYIQAKDGWVDKNITLLEEAVAVKEDQQIYAQIVVSKRLFAESVAEGDDSDLNNIIDRYAKLEVSGYLIWIDDYIEHSELKNSLVHYQKILSKLNQGDKTVYILYGGYFSTLLGHQDLHLVSGVSHGLEYGESRAVVPVGGGIPRAKFYLPKLHKRVDFPDMVEFLSAKNIDSKAKYHKEICNCGACQELITSNNILDDFTQAFGQTKSTTIKRGERLVTLSFSTKETKDFSLKHYLASKKIEFSDVSVKSIEDLQKDLESSLVEMEGVLDNDYTDHLRAWIAALQTIRQSNTNV